MEHIKNRYGNKWKIKSGSGKPLRDAIPTSKKPKTKKTRYIAFANVAREVITKKISAARRVRFQRKREKKDATNVVATSITISKKDQL